MYICLVLQESKGMFFEIHSGHFKNKIPLNIAPNPLIKYGKKKKVSEKCLVCENVNNIVLLSYSDFRMTRICPKNTRPQLCVSVIA